MTIIPPDPDLTALRVEFARLRVERGWTFDELARRSGLARRTVPSAKVTVRAASITRTSSSARRTP